MRTKYSMVNYKIEIKTKTGSRQTLNLLTVGGDRFIAELRLSCGPMLECRRMGRPLPGVPPGEDAQDGAILILGVISVLSESRRLGNAFPTRRKLLSGDEGDPPNHQPPMTPDPVEFLRAMSSALDVLRWSMRKLGMLKGGTCMLSEENWWRNGRCGGEGIERLSSFSLLRCCRSMWSSISCSTCRGTALIGNKVLIGRHANDLWSDNRQQAMQNTCLCTT